MVHTRQLIVEKLNICMVYSMSLTNVWDVVLNLLKKNKMNLKIACKALPRDKAQECSKRKLTDAPFR